MINVYNSNNIYYIDTGVVQENTALVQFIQNCIGANGTYFPHPH